MAKLLDAAVSPFKPKRAALFVGWFKGRAGWQPVVEAQSERECWKLVMSYKDPLSLNCERTVMRAGQKPTGRRRGR